MTRSGFYIVVLPIILFSSCVKDTKIEPVPSEPSVPGEVIFKFRAKVKNEDLVPETKMYTNATEDSFTVTKFNYYISNIRLTREDGSVYVESESYHLMEHVTGNTSFAMKQVPPGNYRKVEFLIGVDSLRNVSGVQQGDLNPGRGMFWNWEQGYLFFKLEGAFNTSNTPLTADYAIHVGGFAGPYACLQKCTFNTTQPVFVTGGKRSSVYYNVQIDEVFVTPKRIGFDYYYANTGTEKIFRDISINYKDMFVIYKIEN